MKQNHPNLQIIISTINRYHPALDKAAAQQVLSYEEKIYLVHRYLHHKYWEILEDEERYWHILRIVQYLVEWRFHPSIILAGMLHEEADQLSILSQELPELQDDQRILSLLKGYLFCRDNPELSIEEINTTHSQEAIYILIADRIDILSNEKLLGGNNRIFLARETEEVLIPVMESIQAYYLAERLYEKCLQINNPLIYRVIKSKIREVNQYDLEYQKKLLHRLELIFYHASKRTSEIKSLSQQRKYVLRLQYKERSIGSFFRMINDTNMDLVSAANKCINHQEPFYDLTLVISDSISEQDKFTPVDIFMTYYKEILFFQEGIRVIDYRHTYKKDSGYLILRDQMENHYRLFIKTETNYRHYLLGNISYSLFSKESSHDQIKVFRRNGKALLIKNGSTVLDFAFMIQNDIGIHFDYALINHIPDSERSSYFQIIEASPDPLEEPIHYPMETKLREGDTIVIIPNPSIKPELSWMMHVYTDQAKIELIRYFQEIFNQLSNATTAITASNDTL